MMASCWQAGYFATQGSLHINFRLYPLNGSLYEKPDISMQRSASVLSFADMVATSEPCPVGQGDGQPHSSNAILESNGLFSGFIHNL
jgi:hypothetical protein